MPNFKYTKLFDSYFVANIMKKFYRCPICRLKYEFHLDNSDMDNHVKSNRPILLPCGHNMCENCVYHNRSNIICVTCSSPYVIGEESSKKFANFNVRDYFDMNFFLMGQLNDWRFYCKDGRSNSTLFMTATDSSNLNRILLGPDAGIATYPIMKCVECEVMPSSGVCRICNAYFCKRCFDNVHKNSKALKNHSLQYLNKEPTLPSGLLHLTKSRYCKKHQRKCDSYCKKCDAICCDECARHDHKSHQFKKIEYENEQLMDELCLTLENTNLVREIVNKGQKDIKSVEAQLEDYATETLEKISNFFLSLHSYLQNEEKQIIGHFKEMSHQTQLVLREANMKLNDCQETLKSVRNILEPYQEKSPTFVYLGHILPNYNQVIQQIPSNILISNPEHNPFVFDVKYDLHSSIHNAITYNYNDPNIVIKIDATIFDSNPLNTEATGGSFPTFFNTCNNENESLPAKKTYNKIKKNKTIVYTNTNQNSKADVATRSGIVDNLVHITYIQSPEDFYIHKVKDLQAIRQLSHKYLCNDLRNDMPKVIEEGNCYMTYHMTDKQWYRGVLKKILLNDVYQMFLVDFGVNVEVSRNNLCDIEESELKKPFAALNCAIYDITPVGKKWTEASNALLLELVQNKPVQISIIENVRNAVLKIDIHTDLTKSVRNTFLYTGMAREKPGIHTFKLQPKTNLPNVKITERIPKANINTSDILTVTVLHVEGPQEFSVIKNDVIASNEKLQIQLNQYYNDYSSKLQHLYLGAVQMACAVKINDIWYRAVIENIKDKGQLIVRLVDQGRRCVINWREAFVLAEVFRNKREFAIPCTLADIEPFQKNNYAYTSEAVEDFKQMTRNPQLLMEVNVVTEKFNSVVLYINKMDLDINIGAMLVKHKHGVSTGQCTQVRQILKSAKINNNQPLSVVSSHRNLKANSKDENLKRSLIKVKYLISPNEFYIQLANLVKSNTTFHQQIQEVQGKKYGTKQPISNESLEWHEDNHCLVYTECYSSELPQPVCRSGMEWYRGIITKVTSSSGEEATFSVFLRDIGATISHIYGQQLYSIDPQMDRVTNAVYCCHLACIAPAGGENWSQSAIDSFTHYVMTAETLSASLVANRKHDKKSLAIILWSSKIETVNPLAPCYNKYANINRVLVKKGLAYMVEPLDSTQKLEKLKEMELTNNEIALEEWFKSFENNVALKDIERNENISVSLDNTVDDIDCTNHPFTQYLSEIDFKETTGQKPPKAWLAPKTLRKFSFAGCPTYVDFNGVIYIHDIEDKTFLEKIIKTLTETYGPLEPPNTDLQFAIGQACVVKYHVDSKYYRGIITKHIKAENEWCVQFIDYGNVESVQTKDLRPYAPFPNLPAMANKYVIDGIKPTKNKAKYSVAQLDQMHVMIVTKLVSIRRRNTVCQNNINRCSMRLGAMDVANEFIQRGLAEADCSFLDDEILSEIAKDSPLGTIPIDDNAIFCKGTDMSVDCNYIQAAMEDAESGNDLSDTSVDVDGKNSDKYDHLDQMMNRLSELSNVDQLAKKKAAETTSINASNKPPPKKRMFNNQDYSQMMNVIMVHGADDIVSNYDKDFDHDCNGNEEDEDDDIIGENFAMSYWYNTNNDERDDEHEELNEQLEKKVLSFEEDVESDFDAFHPNDTSTVFSHFSGIENFVALQLPTTMRHFKCRIASIISPTVFQIFPQHKEFRYRNVELHRSIKEMVKRSLPPLTNFEPRTLCLACYSEDKQWYRAVIRSYNPTAKTVEVLYVDYLNSETLPIKCVRQCPKELLSWPLSTFRVRLHGLEVNPNIKENEIRLALQSLLRKRVLFAVVKEHSLFNSMDFGKSSKLTDHVQIDMYESKEAYLKGVTIYESLIEKNYFQRI